MQIILCHGKESSPCSSKLQIIKNIAEAAGYTVLIPDFRASDDLNVRLQQLLDIDFEEPTLLVGMSMGAWISIAASQKKKVFGLFLMSPAWGTSNYSKVQPDAPVIHIVHGKDDEVIPCENALELMKSLPPSVQYDDAKGSTKLSVVMDSHRLQGSIKIIEQEFFWFLKECETWWAAEMGAT